MSLVRTALRLVKNVSKKHPGHFWTVSLYGKSTLPNPMISDWFKCWSSSQTSIPSQIMTSPPHSSLFQFYVPLTLLLSLVIFSTLQDHTTLSQQEVVTCLNFSQLINTTVNCRTSSNSQLLYYELAVLDILKKINGTWLPHKTDFDIPWHFPDLFPELT